MPLIGLCLVLAGCSTAQVGGGSASSSAASGGSGGAAAASGGSGSGSVGCSLLPLADANLVLAVPGITLDSATESSGTSCDYTGKAAAFSTTVKSNQSAADWAAEVAAIKQDVGDAPSIPSLGDRAVGAIRILATQKGSTIIEVNGQVDDTGSAAQNVLDLELIASAMLEKLK